MALLDRCIHSSAKARVALLLLLIIRLSFQVVLARVRVCGPGATGRFLGSWKLCCNTKEQNTTVGQLLQILAI